MSIESPLTVNTQVQQSQITQQTITPVQSNTSLDTSSNLNQLTDAAAQQQPNSIMSEGSKAISDEAIKKQIENLNRLLSARSTSVKLEYDHLSSPQQVNIIDTESRRIIRQIPAEAAIEIANQASKFIMGLVVDKKV